MRAYELYESTAEQLGIKAVLPRGHDLTLRHLNKLNRIRRRREEERRVKLAKVRLIYSDPNIAAQRFEADHERKVAELDLATQEIQHEIEKAKLSDESRTKVQDMAQEALGRRLKD